MNIPIVLSSSNIYQGQLVVTLFSILENAKVSTYDFYILMPPDFSLESKKVIRKLILKYGFSVTFIPMNDLFEEIPVTISHITIHAYYRLLIPRLLPVEIEKRVTTN